GDLGEKRTELLRVRLGLDDLVPNLLAQFAIALAQGLSLGAHGLNEIPERPPLLASQVEFASQGRERRAGPPARELGVGQTANEKHVQDQAEGKRHLYEPAL